MSSIEASNWNTNESLATGSWGTHPLRGLTLVAIRQEEVRLATLNGLVNAQLIKVLRVDHELVPRRQNVGHRLRSTRLLRDRTISSTKPRLRLLQPPLVPKTVQPQSIPMTEYSFDGKRVRLRSVGEVLTDQAGHFYELRGEQLHMLDELVRDEFGRVFEVSHSTSEAKVDKQFNDPKTTAADSTVKLKNRQSILTRLTDRILGLFNKGQNQAT